VGSSADLARAARLAVLHLLPQQYRPKTATPAALCQSVTACNHMPTVSYHADTTMPIGTTRPYREDKTNILHFFIYVSKFGLVGYVGMIGGCA
jgi:hypothetical protein